MEPTYRAYIATILGRSVYGHRLTSYPMELNWLIRKDGLESATRISAPFSPRRIGPVGERLQVQRDFLRLERTRHTLVWSVSTVSRLIHMARWGR